LIKEGEWDTNEFTEMREDLLKKLQIEHNPIDNEAILEKLKSNDEKLEKLDKLEKLEKLDNLEKLEKSYCEKLDKLEKLEKSSCEKLDKLEKLEKLLEEIVQVK
jgi:hypothetical protein